MDLLTAEAKLRSIHSLWVDVKRYALIHQHAQRGTIRRHKRVSTGTLVLASVTTIAAVSAGALEDMARTVAFSLNLVCALATSISKLIEERSDAPNKAATHAKDKHTLNSLLDRIDSVALRIIQAARGSRQYSVEDVDKELAELRERARDSEPQNEVDADGTLKQAAEDAAAQTSITFGLEEVRRLRQAGLRPETLEVAPPTAAVALPLPAAKPQPQASLPAPKSAPPSPTLAPKSAAVALGAPSGGAAPQRRRKPSLEGLTRLSDAGDSFQGSELDGVDEEIDAAEDDADTDEDSMGAFELELEPEPERSAAPSDLETIDAADDEFFEPELESVQAKERAPQDAAERPLEERGAALEDRLDMAPEGVSGIVAVQRRRGSKARGRAGR